MLGAAAARRPGTARSRGVRVFAVVSFGSLLLTAGCSTIDVEGPELTDAEAEVCRSLIADLPQTLVDQPSREVDEPDRAAAWGDPAIVLVCGGEVPESFDEFSECIDANGLGWFIPPELTEDQTADVVMATAGTSPVIAVTLPAQYRPTGPAAAMSGLASPVKRHVTVTNACE